LTDNPWNDGEFARLDELWAEGHTTAEIARRMGRSKNSVVGKAHRRNLPGRLSPIRGRDGDRMAPLARPKPPPLSALMEEQAMKPQTAEVADARPVAKKPLEGAAALLVARARSAVVLAPVEIVKPPAPAPQAVRVPVEREGCRFPLWAHHERVPNPPKFCNAPRRLGISYCSTHAAICFTTAGARLWGRLA
jgi:GcrA cell cycle regulator